MLLRVAHAVSARIDEQSRRTKQSPVTEVTGKGCDAHAGGLVVDHRDDVRIRRNDARR